MTREIETLQIRETNETDFAWKTNLLEKQWGTTAIITRGKCQDAARLTAFVALLRGERVGLLTYHIDGKECEIVSLDSLVKVRGIGSTLVEKVKVTAQKAGCQRVWLITTNDNLHALRFYQKRGFTLSALYPNALEHTRKMQPETPLLGIEEIPLRDEIELESIIN